MRKSITQACKFNKFKSKSGQVLIEYVLLLSVAIGVGTLAAKTLTSDDPENPGFFLKKWSDLRQFIAADDPEDPATPAVSSDSSTN